MRNDTREDIEPKYHPCIPFLLDAMKRETDVTTPWALGNFEIKGNYFVDEGNTFEAFVDEKGYSWPINLIPTAISNEKLTLYEKVGQDSPIANEQSIVNQILNQIVIKGVCVPNYSILGNFLSLGLMDLTRRICDRALIYFGEAFTLSLEVTEDPEIDNRVLTLFVRATRYGDDILDKIDEFRSFFQNEMTNEKNSILVTTDFRKPRMGDCGF